MLRAGTKSDSVFAAGLADKALRFQQAQQFDSSNALYLRSITVWEELGMWKENVRCRLKIAVNLMHTLEYPAALEMLSAAELIAQQNGAANSEETGRIYTYRGYIYSNSEQIAEGISAINEALRRFERSVGTENAYAGWAYYSLGVAYNRSGDYDRSLEALRRSQTLLSSLLDENDVDLAKLHIALGLLYDAKNEFTDAVASFMHALAILEHNRRLFSTEAGQCYINLMSTYGNMGNIDSALEAGAQASDLFGRLGMKESHYMATVYGLYGRIHTMRGDLETARDYSQKSLDLGLTLKDGTAATTGYAYRDLAVIAGRMGEKEKTVDYLKKSIAVLAATYGPLHPQMGFLYEQAGGIYLSQNEYGEALRSYRLAIDARKNIGSSDSRNDLSLLYSSIAETFLQMHNADSAAIYLQRATEMEKMSRQKNITQTALLTRRLGDLRRVQQRTTDALRAYHHALLLLAGEPMNDRIETVPAAVNCLDKKERVELLTLKGSLFEARSVRNKSVVDAERAYSHYRASLDCIDELRRQYRGDGSKIVLANAAGDVYGSACRLAADLYRATNNPRYQEEAFLIADRSKANMLLEKIMEGDAKHFAGIPDSLLERENDLLKKIASAEIQIQKAAERNGTEEATGTLNGIKFDLLEQHKKLVALFEAEYPRYYALKFTRPTYTVDEFRSSLGPQSLLVEYLIDNGTLYIFTLTRNNLEMHTVRNAGSLAATVEKLSGALRRYDEREYLRSSSALAELLFRPIRKELRSARDLIIIPDGPLHTVPFEALPVTAPGKNNEDFTKINYLIRSHDIAYSYSAAFAVTMHAPKRAGTPLPQSFAGFAPVFRDSTKNGDFLANRSYAETSGLTDVRSITLDGKKFNELKYSEDEIDEISGSFGTRSLPHRSFLHTDATESNFKRYSGRYDIVHVATHGFINEKNPKLSALLFSQPNGAGAEDDGILYANETFTLNLNADLLVLSSCESGVGTIVQGEGMMALTRGLFYAGARNIMYSPWKVSDKQTYLLMNSFYAHMLNGDSYSGSLRKAKLEMIASKESAFPAKWSGFVLMGK